MKYYAMSGDPNDMKNEVNNSSVGLPEDLPPLPKPPKDPPPRLAEVQEGFDARELNPFRRRRKVKK